MKATAKPRMWIRVHRYNKKHHCWNWQFQFVLEEDLTTKLQTGKQIPEKRSYCNPTSGRKPKSNPNFRQQFDSLWQDENVESPTELPEKDGSIF